MEEPVLSDTVTTYLPPSSMASSSSSSSPSLLSALKIPKIMAIIFKYLDDETANRTLIFVCRQWFIWNRYQIFRDLYWNSDQLGRNDLSKLRLGPDRLFCNVREGQGGGGDSDHGAHKWKELIDALTSTYPPRRQVRVMEDAQKDCGNIGGGEESKEGVGEGVIDAVVSGLEDKSSRSSSTSKAGDDRKRVIRHLTITGNIDIDRHIREILLGLSHLTSLTMKVDSCGWISIHNILNSCPHLESLHLETVWVHIPEENWLVSCVAHQFEGDLHPHRRLQPGTRTPLVLRSLVLKNTKFYQSSLEHFLPSAPFLRRIQIAVWLPYLRRPEPRECERLCQLIRTHCPLVEVFHFSYQGRHVIRTAPEDMNPVFDLCPRMTDWMVSAAHFTPSLTERLESLRDVLTTLEIIGEECKHLHTYLCTATHLQHLKTPKTLFHYKNMDIHLCSTTEYSHTGFSWSGYRKREFSSTRPSEM